MLQVLIRITFSSEMIIMDHDGLHETFFMEQAAKLSLKMLLILEIT